MGSRNLLRRKTRTLLTIVGVLVGATAIVLMISIALGMTASLDASIARMGDLTLIELYQNGGKPVDSSDPSKGYEYFENKLNDEVLEKIKQLDGVLAASPLIYMNDNVDLIVNSKYKPDWMNLQGIDPAFLPYLNVEIAKGEMPDPDEDNFLILGVDTEYRFIRIGKQIMNWNKEFYYSDGTQKPPKVDLSNKVIAYLQGVYNQWGYWDQQKQQWVELSASSRKPKFTKFYLDKVAVMKQSDRNRYSWYSFTSVNIIKDLQREIYKSQRRKDTPLDNYQYILVKAADLASAEAVQKVLSEEMGLTLSYNLADERKEMQKQQATLQMMLSIIGAVSLLVAAIGIANTMYMSIYERTKEIGVMKVLGCPLGGIQSMFLFEAGMIGFFGGLAGIGVSMLASYIMNNVPKLSDALSKIGNSTPQYYYYYAAQEVEKVPVSIIPLWLIGLTILFATLIGLFAGYFPARRATKISALEAIRNE